MRRAKRQVSFKTALQGELHLLWLNSWKVKHAYDASWCRRGFALHRVGPTLVEDSKAPTYPHLFTADSTDSSLACRCGIAIFFSSNFRLGHFSIPPESMKCPNIDYEQELLLWLNPLISALPTEGNIPKIAACQSTIKIIMWRCGEHFDLTECHY